MQFMATLADMLHKKLSYKDIHTMGYSAVVINVSHFEVVLRHDYQENGLLVAVRLVNKDIRHEAVWTLLDDLASQLCFQNNELQNKTTVFVCPQNG